MHLTTYWWIVGGCDVLYEKIVNPCHGQLSLFIRRIHHCTMPSGDGAQSPNSVVVRSDRPWLLVARLFPHQPTIARSSAQDIDGKQYQPRQPVEAVVVMSLGVLTTVVHRVLNQVAIAHESGLSRHPMFASTMSSLETTTPPPKISWRLGQVIALLSGIDGVIRVVRLRTTHGQVTQPLSSWSFFPAKRPVQVPPVRCYSHSIVSPQGCILCISVLFLNYL